MTLTYRDDLDRPLTSLEVDTNFRTLSDRLEYLDDKIPAPAVVGEAPLDGKQYARQNAGWSVVVTSSAPAGIQHATSNGSIYGSKDGGWVAFTPGIGEAPDDGQSYVRKNKNWAVAASGGSGGGGGSGNLRHIGTWAQTLNIEKYDVVEFDGMLWMARDTYFKSAPSPGFSTDSEGYWRSMGFPSGDTNSSSTLRIRHTFSTANRTDQATLSAILNGFENRLKAAEDKLTNHETRIAALEANFAMS